MQTLLAIIFDFLIISLFSLSVISLCFVFKKPIKRNLQDFLDIKTDKVKEIKDGARGQ